MVEEYAVGDVARQVVPARAAAPGKQGQQRQDEHQAEQDFLVVGVLQTAVPVSQPGGHQGQAQHRHEQMPDRALHLLQVVEDGAEEEIGENAGQQTVAEPVAVDFGRQGQRDGAHGQAQGEQKQGAQQATPALGDTEQERCEQVELDFGTERPGGRDQSEAVATIPHVVVERDDEQVVEVLDRAGGGLEEVAQAGVIRQLRGEPVPEQGQQGVEEVLRHEAHRPVGIEARRLRRGRVMPLQQPGHDVAGDEIEADDGADAGIEAGNAVIDMAGGDGQGEQEAQATEHGWRPRWQQRVARPSSRRVRSDRPGRRRAVPPGRRARRGRKSLQDHVLRQ